MGLVSKIFGTHSEREIKRINEELSETNEKLDKDRFRRDLGMVSEAYQEVENRLLKE